MEPCGRRNRRGRCRSQNFTPPPQRPMMTKLISTVQSFVITASLIVLIYMMLEYHCKTCTAKCDLQKITRNIDEIAVNLSKINRSYQALERKVLLFSQELPRIEGQIDILEALANTMEYGGYGWNPRTHLALPSVDVYLNRPAHKIKRNLKKNCTNVNTMQSKPVQVS